MQRSACASQSTEVIDGISTFFRILRCVACGVIWYELANPPPHNSFTVA